MAWLSDYLAPLEEIMLEVKDYLAPLADFMLEVGDYLAPHVEFMLDVENDQVLGSNGVLIAIIVFFGLRQLCCQLEISCQRIF